MPSPKSALPAHHVLDPRPAAAHRLGYHSRMAGRWIADCVESPRAADITRAGLVAGLNELDGAVLTLEAEIDARAREDLRQAIGAVKGRATGGGDPGLTLAEWKTLPSEADRAALRLKDLRRWYDLGAAVGCYHLLARGLEFGEPLPDFGDVLATARQIVKKRCRVPVLKSLVQFAGGVPAPSVRQLLCGALQDFEYETDTYPQGIMDRATVCILLARLHDRLHGQLSGLTRREAPSGTDGQGPGAPVWDETRKALTWGGATVRQFRAPAKKQRGLVEAFHRANWAPSIPDPFGDNRTLEKTVTDLNKTLAPGTIRFRRDGTGEGVLWEPSE